VVIWRCWLEERRHRGGERGGDNVSWADVNLTGPKNEKKYTIDSTAINDELIYFILFKKIYAIEI
jgi:hypothetical protein